MKMIGVCLVLMSVITLQPVKEENLPDPQDVLRQIVDAERKVDFVGRRLVIGFGGRYNMVREEKVINKSPDKQRIEVLAPPEMAGSGLIRLGKQVWRIPPKMKGKPSGPPPYRPGPPPATRTSASATTGNDRAGSVMVCMMVGSFFGQCPIA